MTKCQECEHDGLDTHKYCKSSDAKHAGSTSHKKCKSCGVEYDELIPIYICNSCRGWWAKDHPKCPQAIIDKAHLTGQNLAVTCGKLESSNETEIAQQIRKVQNMLESFGNTIQAQANGPNRKSAVKDFGIELVDNIIRHDKVILALISEIGDYAAGFMSGTGTRTSDTEGSVKQISEASRKLQSQINMRDEILKSTC